MADILVDWLSLTWKPDNLGEFSDYFSSFEALFPEFRLNDSWSSIRCRSHYSVTLAHKDGIFLEYDSIGEFSKGVFVNVPSSGLDSFMRLFDSRSIVDIIQDLVDRGMRLSRLDLAFDDYSKKFYPLYYENKRVGDLRRSALISRSHTSCFGYISGDSSKGETFYCGSLKKRQKILRIYDKNKESDGLINAIRYEFELHGNYARSAFNDLLSGTFSFKGLLLDTFRVVDLDSGNYKNNISSCFLDREWESWLNMSFANSSNSYHISTQNRSTTIEKRITYVLSSWPMSVLSYAAKYLGQENIMDLVRSALFGKNWTMHDCQHFADSIAGFEMEFLQNCKLLGMQRGIY